MLNTAETLGFCGVLYVAGYDAIIVFLFLQLFSALCFYNNRYRAGQYAGSRYGKIYGLNSPYCRKNNNGDKCKYQQKTV